MKSLFIAVLACAPAFLSASALTNENILELLEAGLSEELVVTTIQSSETDFDTSAMALIQLKKAGIPEAVMEAMLKPKAAAEAPSPEKKDTYRPDVVFVEREGKHVEMQYLVPTTRTKARALGFGGVVTYMVMRGSHSGNVLSDPQPTFIVSVPSNAQPASYVDLASFAVRGNDSREVLVGGGYMSYSTGIHPDRRMPFTTEKMADQSKAAEGFTLYSMTPEQPLVSGEYAIVFYNSEVAVVGYFSGGTNSCFDFAIE